ncbi:MAG: translation initiation factor IF-2 [Candidatus Omnitrophica bacterium]|nr:translation initiation factor IF-2 [Candidatus Omnitrophota bacterium]
MLKKKIRKPKTKKVSIKLTSREKTAKSLISKKEVSKTIKRSKITKASKVKKVIKKVKEKESPILDLLLEEKSTVVSMSPEVTEVSSPRVETEEMIGLEKSTDNISSTVELKKPKVIELEFPITLRELAVKFQQKPSVLINKLMEKGVLVAINQNLDENTVEQLAQDFDLQIQKAKDIESTLLDIHRESKDSENLNRRPPVVAFMGHVDHGKTSLLDTIRKTKVAESEYGGITQHIGAYQISIRTRLHPEREDKITFLDTPGHEAFTRMRARGARITDIVVLVVAADEGVMPQTIEAINHSREAGVPIMVAINKIDKPNVDIERVKKQLSEYGLIPEEWQGNTVFVGVSAKTGQGIDDLLELILLQAEIMDLKANYEKLAKGVVIESQLSSERGVMATFLVQNGTLKLNDNLLVGLHYGKIRAMFDEYGRVVSEAPPSTPVKVLGLSGLPQPGDEFFVVTDEKQAREISQLRMERKQQPKSVRKISLEELSSQIKEGKIKEFKIILKVDATGSLEAIKEILDRIEIPQISINIIHAGIGDVNTSDVLLASASNAIILGFNVSYESRVKDLIIEEGVEVRIYNVIYELTNELRSAMEGMLEPKTKRVFLGRAEVRKVFRLSKVGVVAGCFVSKGRILRNAYVCLLRNGKVIYEGRISSLKRFKDDVREISEGMECGISLGEFQEIFEGDVIEAYEIQKITHKII